MALAGEVVRAFRALSPDRLLGLHERWLRATFAPDTDISALSCPRGNAKSATAGRLLALSMLEGSPLYREGLETICASASLKQGRIVWGFSRRALGAEAARFSFQDSDQRITARLGKRGPVVASIISSSGKGAMGLSEFDTLILDEPGALETRGGRLLYDALRQSLGKVEGQRLLLIGTRAPAEPGTWWPDLLDAGSQRGTHVTQLSAPPEAPWDSWATIRKVNPVANVHAPLRRMILRERDDARRNPTLRPSFEAYRLNRLVETIDEMLIDAEDWRRVEARDVPPREGRPYVGIDLGSERSWSAAWCLWPNGRSECYAVAPGIPGLAQRERQDAMPKGLYERLAGDGVLIVEEGKRVSNPETLVALLEAKGIRPRVTLQDRFLLGRLRDAVGGRWPLVERVTRWSEATEDVSAFRQLVKNGPLSVVPECRNLARVSIGQAVVKSDDQGSVRLTKKRHSRSRDDVAVAATLAAGALARQMRKPKRRAPVMV